MFRKNDVLKNFAKFLENREKEKRDSGTTAFFIEHHRMTTSDDIEL